MTTDRRELLDANDFHNDLAEAETFLLANQPKRPQPSQAEQRELDAFQAQLDEAAELRDAALAARRTARRALVEANEVEHARQQEGQGFAGMVRWVTGGKKHPSVAAATAAVEEAEQAFTAAEVVHQNRHRRLNAANVRIGHNLQLARAAAERKGAA